MSENKYQNGKIYKIVSNETDRIYIGSTCEKYLSNRLAGHISEFKRYKEGKTKKYTSSFKLLELKSYEIILIEAYSCNSKAELNAREYYYIKQIENNTVNEVIPKKTPEEIEIDKKRRNDIKQNKFYQCECGVYRLNRGWREHEITFQHKKYMRKLQEKNKTSE